MPKPEALPRDWAPFTDRWRLTADLLPGESAAAVLVQYNRGDDKFVDTLSVGTIYDHYDQFPTGEGTAYGQNFGLIGEVFRTRFNPENGFHEIIGSQGLHRRGVVTEVGGIAAGQSGEVTIYDSQASASCSGSATNTTVDACARVSGVDKDAEVCVNWHPEFKKWFIAGAGGGAPGVGEWTTLVRVKNTTGTAILPGATGKSLDLWSWTSGGGWVDTTTTVTCQNTNGDCCMLDGEFNWAIKLGSSNYELMPFGLERWAKVDETAGIDVGASGTFNFMNHTGGTCAGVEETSDHFIEVCNGTEAIHGTRKLFNNENCIIRYFLGKWLIVQIPRAIVLGQFTSGTLADGASNKTFNIYDSSGTQWGSNTLTGVINRTGKTMENSVLYEIKWLGNSSNPTAHFYEGGC